MPVRTRALCIAAALVAASFAPLSLAASQATFRVIVHPDNPLDQADRRFLADAFFKRIRTWPDGETIYPVDRETDAPVRVSFTEAILARSTTAVRSYWQQQIFSGRDLPPPELGSDSDILAYVRAHRGAVGYVSGDGQLAGVKAIDVR